jgi:Fe-S-cluster-containing hydrogenase component 2
MVEYHHGFRLDEDACGGCFACMRACPTDAIRVRDGRSHVLNDLCIDCGSCLTACPRDVITATTTTLEEFDGFAYKVAVPSPVLWGQFPLEVRPEHIARGLLAVGFDAVWDFGVDMRLATHAIADYVDAWKGPWPVIAITCPVIVRLLQVSYPKLLEQLICMKPPREIAGREVKRRYSQELGLPPEKIAAIYIAACQAKTVSIEQPAEGGHSSLDGAVGIPQIYNSLLAAARDAAKNGESPDSFDPVRSASMVSWSTPRPLADLPSRHRYMSVTGLPNVIKVLDDVERGRLKNIDFLECSACWAGCANGNLTVDNVYVSQAKLQSLARDLPYTDPGTEAEVERRYPNEDFSLARAPEPRTAAVVGDLRERVRRMQEAQKMEGVLPGYDCGLCGTPSCKVMAHDVAAGEAQRDDCIFLSKRRIEELRRQYRGKG